MRSFYLTDAGKVRGHNEDSVTILKNKSNEYLLMVADGMGGHRAGEVASSLVVTHIGSRFQNMSTLGNKVDAITWLKEIIEEVKTEKTEKTDKTNIKIARENAPILFINTSK